MCVWEHVASCVPRVSFDVASRFGGERRDCRSVVMTHAVSLVLRANKLPIQCLFSSMHSAHSIHVSSDSQISALKFLSPAMSPSHV